VGIHYLRSTLFVCGHVAAVPSVRSLQVLDNSAAERNDLKIEFATGIAPWPVFIRQGFQTVRAAQWMQAGTALVAKRPIRMVAKVHRG
jgi:hypothetical protein